VLANVEAEYFVWEQVGNIHGRVYRPSLMAVVDEAEQVAQEYEEV